MKRTYEEACKLVANWWAEKSFETLLNQNNGDDSPTGGMVFMLQNMVSMEAKKDVSEEKIEKFKNKIVELLLLENNEWRQMLQVDYHPDRILGEACKFAEINEMVLPCKSYTVIEKDNTVKGSFQYQGKLLEVN